MTRPIFPAWLAVCLAIAARLAPVLLVAWLVFAVLPTKVAAWALFFAALAFVAG